MSIKGDVVMTINGQRVDKVREIHFNERAARCLVLDRELVGVGMVEVIHGQQPDGSMVRIERVPPRGWMRQAMTLHVQKEGALETWRNFNQVYGLPCGWTRRRKPPKPTPKQYRLKRRAAGAKRRMRAR